MGICISSRRPPLMNDNEEDASSTTSSSRFKSSGAAAAAAAVAGKVGAEMLNPARLILDSPRISTDLGEMSMLGMFFHKKYCKAATKSSSSNSATATGAAAAAVVLEKLEEHPASASTIMNANALFDQYPTFDLPKAASKQEQHRWVSAGEDFYSDWEDRSALAAAAAPVELDVFEAEQYFKEEQAAASASASASGAAASDDLPFKVGTSMRCSSASECSSSAATTAAAFRRASSATSAASGMWVSCASGSAIDADEVAPLPPPARRSSSSKQLSRVFKLLASHGKSHHKQQQQQQQQKTTKSSSNSSSGINSSSSSSSKMNTEVRVKDWMDRARNSADETAAAAAEAIKLEAPVVKDPLTSSSAAATTAAATTSPAPAAASSKNSASASIIVIAPPQDDNAEVHYHQVQGFGSPFPGSPGSDSKDQPTTLVGPRVTAQRGDEDGAGHESDSSSDLFELDSVTTSLSSARSSLSRMSSARSSIRKSTADEQDMLTFKAEATAATTSVINHKQHSSSSRNSKCEPEKLGIKNRDPAKRRRPCITSSSSSVSSNNNRKVSTLGLAAPASASSAAASKISVIEEEAPRAPLPRQRPTGNSSSSSNRMNHRSWNHSSGALVVQT